MQYYLIVLVFQVLFNIFKVLEIKFTYENKITRLLIISVFMNIVALSSVFFSLGRMFENDWLIVPFYISGSVIGKWIAMTRFENTRFKVFRFLIGKK